MFILQIDTSTAVCSCALSQDGETIQLQEKNEPNAHASALTLLIDALLKDAQISFSDLGAVAVSMGPGSYTGLRIGVSTAKGLCYASDIPLIAVPTLEAMAWGFLQQHAVPEGTWCIPMIDARRMEVYSAVYDHQLHPIKETAAQIIDEHSFDDLTDQQPVVLFGTGANKLANLFQENKKVTVVSDFEMSAAYMSALAYTKAQKDQFEDIAYFEPFYLKEFVATVPKKRSLQG